MTSIFSDCVFTCVMVDSKPAMRAWIGWRRSWITLYKNVLSLDSLAYASFFSDRIVGVM